MEKMYEILKSIFTIITIGLSYLISFLTFGQVNIRAKNSSPDHSIDNEITDENIDHQKRTKDSFLYNDKTKEVKVSSHDDKIFTSQQKSKPTRVTNTTYLQQNMTKVGFSKHFLQGPKYSLNSLIQHNKFAADIFHRSFSDTLDASAPIKRPNNIQNGIQVVFMSQGVQYTQHNNHDKPFIIVSFDNRNVASPGQHARLKVELHDENNKKSFIIDSLHPKYKSYNSQDNIFAIVNQIDIKFSNGCESISGFVQQMIEIAINRINNIQHATPGNTEELEKNFRQALDWIYDTVDKQDNSTRSVDPKEIKKNVRALLLLRTMLRDYTRTFAIYDKNRPSDVSSQPVLYDILKYTKIQKKDFINILNHIKKNINNPLIGQHSYKDIFGNWIKLNFDEVFLGEIFNALQDKEQDNSSKMPFGDKFKDNIKFTAFSQIVSTYVTLQMIANHKTTQKYTSLLLEDTHNTISQCRQNTQYIKQYLTTPLLCLHKSTYMDKDIITNSGLINVIVELVKLEYTKDFPKNIYNFCQEKYNEIEKTLCIHTPSFTEDEICTRINNWGKNKEYSMRDYILLNIISLHKYGSSLINDQILEISSPQAKQNVKSKILYQMLKEEKFTKDSFKLKTDKYIIKHDITAESFLHTLYSLQNQFDHKFVPNMKNDIKIRQQVINRELQTLIKYFTCLENKSVLLTDCQKNCDQARIQNLITKYVLLYMMSEYDINTFMIGNSNDDISTTYTRLNNKLEQSLPTRVTEQEKKRIQEEVISKIHKDEQEVEKLLDPLRDPKILYELLSKKEGFAKFRQAIEQALDLIDKKQNNLELYQMVYEENSSNRLPPPSSRTQQPGASLHIDYDPARLTGHMQDLFQIYCNSYETLLSLKLYSVNINDTINKIESIINTKTIYDAFKKARQQIPGFEDSCKIEASKHKKSSANKMISIFHTQKYEHIPQTKNNVTQYIQQNENNLSLQEILDYLCNASRFKNIVFSLRSIQTIINLNVSFDKQLSALSTVLFNLGNHVKNFNDPLNFHNGEKLDVNVLAYFPEWLQQHNYRQQDITSIMESINKILSNITNTINKNEVINEIQNILDTLPSKNTNQNITNPSQEMLDINVSKAQSVIKAK
ncbi:MAG: hypothetical protein P857_1078 [Candidatus Xenolissoclinum pacificiensis L6]|uniref:Transmembrane protein n=1 Tax=Candidatus Xenolissoclinum pacificiensis L6 TaxID=1401685 RepID=W2V359_9RICK|nr:MAG: hypothetical protein P857_1078 [Candidatus Xenolissoclinum pacificiensis L6]